MHRHIFICHASEDKDDFVRPLAKKLKDAGVLVWFDEFALNTGDSLRESIDKGLSNSSYGIVVLSKYFFQKKWTKRELNGLFAKDISEDKKTILPIWYNIDYSQILKESPLVADIVGIKYAGNIDDVVDQICDTINMDDPYNQMAGEQYVRLLKSDGSEAKWIIRRTVQVNRNPLEFMNVRISTEGKLTLVFVYPGALDRFVNISGTRMAQISYSPPIEPGSVFTQELIFHAKDMYCEEENAASIVPTLPYDSFTLAVEVPDLFSIKNVRVLKSISGKLHDIGGLEVENEKRLYKVCIQKPEVGFLHMLIWEKYQSQ